MSKFTDSGYGGEPACVDSGADVPSSNQQVPVISSDPLDPDNMLEDSILWSRANYPLTAVSRYRDAAHEIARQRREIQHLEDMLLSTIRPVETFGAPQVRAALVEIRDLPEPGYDSSNARIMRQIAAKALSSSEEPTADDGMCKHDDGACHEDDPCETCPVYRRAENGTGGV